MGNLAWIFISAMVVNNFTLAYFLGLCPFMGVSGKIYTALRMGAARQRTPGTDSSRSSA